MSEEAQARSHALQRQLALRAPQPRPHPPPQSELAQLACAYAAEGSVSGSVTGSVLSRAASPPFFLSAGLSGSLLPDGVAGYGEYGASYSAGYGAGEHGAEYGAEYGAASWSEQESSPPAGHILPLGTPRDTPGGEAAARMYRGYAPRS